MFTARAPESLLKNTKLKFSFGHCGHSKNTQRAQTVSRWINGRQKAEREVCSVKYAVLGDGCSSLRDGHKSASPVLTPSRCRTSPSAQRHKNPLENEGKFSSTELKVIEDEKVALYRLQLFP